MAHVVPFDGGGERIVIRLMGELGCVHANRHEHVGPLLLERPQLVQDVQAVDAGEGPEIEEHNAAAQVSEAQLMTPSVQPASTAGELRCPNACRHAFSQQRVPGWRSRVLP